MDLSQRMEFCPVTTLCCFFLKILFHFKILLRVYLMYQQPKWPYSYCSLAREFHLSVFFPVSILTGKQIFAATIRNDLNTNVSCFMITAI